MKRKITLTIIIFLIVIISIIIFSKDKEQIKETKEENISSFISMMVEQDVDSSNYVENTDIKFPLEGYHFNSEESGCENGGTLSWNSEKQKVEASLLTSDKCYAYFDNVQVKSDFSYTGNYEEYVVPSTGIYKIELWGASGGDAELCKGGNGAYTTGNIKLKKGEKLYVYVGEQGKTVSNVTSNDSYNGGDSAWTLSSSDIAGSGGGATDIRLKEGEWDNFEGLKSRIMVAAGGGGAYYHPNFNGNGSAGGALNGISPGYSICNNNRTYYAGNIAMQNKGASINGCGTDFSKFESTFGKASKYSGNSWNSGGGGGYYGGGSGYATGSSGGSSFISGYPGCNAIAESSTEDTIVHTGQPIHYSGKVFTDYEMIAGSSLMSSPDGGTEEGHTGNGYAKITLVK